MEYSPITRAALTIEDIVREGAELPTVQTVPPTSTSTRDDNEVDTPLTSEAEFSDTTSDADCGQDFDADDLGTSRPDEFGELERTNQQALNEQTIARALYDLDIASPKLAQLCDWLQAAHLDKASDLDIQRARSVHATLKSLTAQLNRMLTEVDNEMTPFVGSSTHSHAAHSITLSEPTPSHRSTKRLYPDILAPPVEKRSQKRKTSYNVH